MNSLIALKNLKKIIFTCMIFCMISSSFYAAQPKTGKDDQKDSKKIEICTRPNSSDQEDLQAFPLSRRDSISCIEQFEQFSFDEPVIARFIDDVINNRQNKVKAFLASPTHDQLFDRASARIATESTTNDNLLEILFKNKIISLLIGPNGPLVEALLKLPNYANSSKKKQTVSNHLSEAFNEYSLLSISNPQKTINALMELIDSEFSSLTVIPLLHYVMPLFLQCKAITQKITPEQGRLLLFKAAAGNDQTTVSSFFDTKEVDNQDHVHKVLGTAKEFFEAALTFPLKKNKLFSETSNASVLPRLLQNQLFFDKFLTYLNAHKSIRLQLQETFLHAAITKTESTNKQNTAIVKRLLQYQSTSDFLTNDTLQSAWNQAEETRKEIISDELARRQPTPSKPRDNCSSWCFLMSPSPEASQEKDLEQELIDELKHALDDEEKKEHE